MEKTFKVLHFDLLTNWKVFSFLAGFFFLFGLYYAYMVGNLIIIPISIMIWLSMATGLLFVTRNRFKLDYLMFTFPINRRNIIRSRFIYNLIIGFLGVAMSELMVCLLAGIFYIGFDIKSMFLIQCSSFLLYCIIISIHLPLYFKLNNVTFLPVTPLFLYIFALLGYQLYSEGNINLDLDQVIAAAWSLWPLILACTLLLSGLLLSISYIITLKIYINKDIS